MRALEQRRSFGLNFERHAPESVELPGRPVRVGDKVRFLPARGQEARSVEQALWRVVRIKRAEGQRIAQLVRPGPRQDDGDKTQTTITDTRAVEDLIVVAEFRDPIYPGLVSTGKVERGGDKPYHSIINAENFHALQALLYTHAGKVDVIYIDPPYNTGAKDWKYNNDYVDGEDAYRHSKWLAFMERRLKVARQLLNPDNSVLICTIDEKEYLRLGLLLEQTFPEASIQMNSTVIAPQGSQRSGRFSRIEEYIFCVFLGDAVAVPIGDSMIQTAERIGSSKVTWDSLIRRGTDATRKSREEMFYPIVIDKNTRRVVEVGEPLGAGNPTPEPARGEAYIVKWPIRTDGSEGRWQLGRDTFIKVLKNGMARVGSSYAVTYLKEGQRQQIKNGDIVNVGSDKFGYPSYESRSEPDPWPRTIWNKSSHNASVYGSTLLRSIIPGRKFPFPKSLYAVEDTLRFFVTDKPNAIVLDFFSGSGTTGHAVMRLNKQDGGRRQCIMVTNNEVSADEQVAMRKKGLRPGDVEWERLGICDYITKPRIQAAITGRTPEGEPIKGDYKFTDEFPMSDGFEENVGFFSMSYEDPLSVEHNQAFAAIAPLLWLKAGAHGARIEEVSEDFAMADTYGVLFDLDSTEPFLEALADDPRVRMVFIVTDDELGFQSACAELPERVEAVRLYESYLSNFRINIGLVE